MKLEKKITNKTGLYISTYVNFRRICINPIHICLNFDSGDYEISATLLFFGFRLALFPRWDD